MVYCGVMSNPIHCPDCNDLMLEGARPFFGGFMRVCFNCGKPWEIRSDWKTVTVLPFDTDNDPVIEDIIKWNYNEGRRERGLL